MSPSSAALNFLLVTGGLLLACFGVIIVGIPLLKVLGALVAAAFRGAAWFVRHIVEFVAGMLGDVVRLVGALIAAVVLMPLMAVSVVLGRWSRASHYASSVTRELKVCGACLYRFFLRRPLKLLLLDGVLEGVEQRVPEAMMAAPAPEAGRRTAAIFEGYRIVGSLRAGGSGAKLYVAEPDEERRRRQPGLPELVVIKSFAITDGSTLPQIVRESRALEAARRMNLVLDHGMDEERFFYVMPYHAGENLGVVTRQLHGEAGGDGLSEKQLRLGVGYVSDLVRTLAMYHRGGLWHKDVKPENIIVHNGTAHLVDLGLVTALRSAMTLTTHGTEYFRDPEMVRMALRGVKVHQIDGARFDVYAAGAVLYFVLENTFPAHGALSAFSRRSPECLRWIVRRAMAEYTKRYESAEAMLADVEHVLAAPDLNAVRPADLPSMSAPGARPWTPPPPMPPAPPMPVAAAAAGAAGHPRLHVTNWWTGAYTVAPASPPETRAAARVRSAPPPPTRPAPEQLVAARRRAAEMRARAQARAARHVARRPNQPSRALVVLTALIIGALVLGAMAMIGGLFTQAGPQRGIAWAGMAPPIPADIAAPPAGAAPLRVVLVNTHPDPAHPAVLAETLKAIDRYMDRGFAVCDEDVEAAAALAPLMQRWQHDRRGFDEALEDVLAAHGFYGVVWISAVEGGGPAAERTRVTFVYSERPDAVQRRGQCPAPVELEFVPGGSAPTDDAVQPAPAEAPNEATDEAPSAPAASGLPKGVVDAALRPARGLPVIAAPAPPLGEYAWAA